MWTVNSATHIGKDHQFSMKNKQDFCEFVETDEFIIGVVCDGCSEGKYSEVGATLTGRFLLNELSFSMPLLLQYKEIRNYAKCKMLGFMQTLISNTFWSNSFDERSKTRFVNDHLLFTTLILLVDKQSGKCCILHNGDGIYMVDGVISVIEQDGSPHYLAYELVPKHALEKQPSEIDSNFSLVECMNPARVMIASDGLIPLIEREELVAELFGTKGRQLQRKVNVWSEKKKMFFDDTSVIVVENRS